MKKRRIWFMAIGITILISVIIIVCCIKVQNSTVGPGNINHISAEIIQMNDSSNYEVSVVEGNDDFNIGDKIWIKSDETPYEKTNDEIAEIYDLSEGDTVMIMYFEYDGNTINRVRAVERISKLNS